MSCIEQMKYKLLLEKTTFKDAREFIKKNSEEAYTVDPGYKIFKDYYIIGVPPIVLGVKGNALLFTYTKPCHGTYVMTIDSEESTKEINRLREMEKEKVLASMKKGKTIENSAAPPASFQDVWKK